LLSIGKSSNHVVGVVPLETVDHVANLVQFRSVDLSHEHVSVVIYEDHFALSWHINLVKFHLDDVGCVVN
jgi:hypothetical protein